MAKKRGAQSSAKKKSECVMPRWRGRNRAQKTCKAAASSAKESSRRMSFSSKDCGSCEIRTIERAHRKTSEMKNEIFDILLFLWSMSGRMDAARQRKNGAGEPASTGKNGHTARKSTRENAMCAIQFIYTLSVARSMDLKEAYRRSC